MTSSARQAKLASLAAVAASLGDFLLLYVANARRPELALPPIGRAWLWLGGALGVLAIPVYALGYRSASRLVGAASVRGARALFAAGAAGALLGAVIHGLTAAQILGELDAAAPARAPVAALLGSGPLLLGLWGLADLLVLFASTLFSWFVGRGRTALPRAAALANPALLSVALAAAALPSVLLQSFLAPAAPNLAHLIFFAVCFHLLRAGSGSPNGGTTTPPWA